MAKKTRQQIPLSFNLNDPQEREIFEWLDQMRTQAKNKKGNISAVIKKILFAYIDREKERETVANKILLMQWEDKLVEQKMNASASISEEKTDQTEQDDDMNIDSDSLPF